MSLGEILSSALSGLGAAQAGMRTVSNNIANVSTPGYAREKISLQTSVTAGRTTGVTVGEPSRVADRFLEESVYLRSGDAGRAAITSDYLDRLQSLLGATGSTSALPARIDAISAAATAMTGTSATAQTNAAFIGDVDDAITSMQQLSADVSRLKSDADGEVSTGVERINALLKQIGDLNDAVSRLSGLGRSTAGPADQRTAALQELSGLIGITAREQANGKVQVETANGVPLIDQRVRRLTYASGGVGADQSVYPAIEVHFANPDGTTGAATGEKLDTPAVGGTLGGLLDLRDNELPVFAGKLGSLYDGLTRALNAAANEGTAVPAPAILTGRTTALASGDRLGFTGAISVAVTTADGTLVAKKKVDFTALGAGATVADAINAINTGLGGAATASFANGKLTITAANSAQGVAIAQDATSPSARAGMGFSQYFGMNDLVASSRGTLAPSGFVGTDAHGFAAGGQASLALRDASGRLLAKATLTPAAGGTFADLVTSLNAGDIGKYGSFALGTDGRMSFTPSSGNVGANLSVLSDTTNRAGTGRSFSEIAGLTGDTAGLAGATVRRDIAADPTRLPLARVQDVAVGAKALGVGDRRGATTFVDALAGTMDLGREGSAVVARFAAMVLGDAGTAASRATSRTDETGARRDDAVSRRDNFSGVNIDEELGQMVVLQNSYSAAARVMTTTSQMFDTLLAIRS